MSEIFKFKLIPSVEIYYNDDTLYGIYKFTTEHELPNAEEYKGIFDNNEVSYTSTIIGKMQKLTIGLDYECEATQVWNKKYNQWQFEVTKIVPQKPTSIEEQSKFLKCIITDNQANILLKTYPNIVDMIINNEEIDLSLTKGIKEITFNRIKEKVMENYVLADILTILRPLGVTISTIKKLQEYQPNPILLKRDLKNNPYILTRIKGLGFNKIDKLALSINPSLKISAFRAKAYIEYSLRELGDNEGHTRIKLQELNNMVKSNLPNCYDIYLKIIEQEVNKESFLHIENEYVGLLQYFETEIEIFDRLTKLNNSECSFNPTDDQIEIAFTRFKSERGYELTEEQKKAVTSLKTNNVAIISGSAGTGKSSIIDAVMKMFPKNLISQTALSAKASRRMSEVTGKDSSTIHRLLGFNGKKFEYNETNPLDADIVILDEASMVNSSIFLSLIKALKLGCKFLIVFDYAQLPPIGAGNIATDLLNSNFSVNVLTKVHRQAESSGILSDANIIRNGINPLEKLEYNIIRGELKDMHYKFRMTKQEIFDLVIKFYMKSIETLSLDDVCICVPRKNTVLNSAFEYNNKIQELLLGKEKACVKHGIKTFKLGAKVIQKVNNYEKNVVNGEIGYIDDINIYDKLFVVKYEDNKKIEYEFKELDELELAYALTVHSTQGSQYNTVIFPIDTNSYTLLSKELIYTGITRSMKRCLVIAEPKAFNMGIKKKSNKRNTWLQFRLQNNN